ncbi:hypothetical protein B0H65DRAFT_130866 [Neurospora tetraspora]|uniref:Uncharacterized protein n=1 Tax=Neurospora tetraspora TaxID=94610 RepID=A0AAE0JL95_9PEZI|nr:hypothetical protein B0H65DRAFT_130866 [Neurospora tetraspora]
MRKSVSSVMVSYFCCLPITVIRPFITRTPEAIKDFEQNVINALRFIQNDRIHVVDPPEALMNSPAKERKQGRTGPVRGIISGIMDGIITITPIPGPWHRQYKISHPTVHRPSPISSSIHPVPAPGPQSAHIPQRP